MIINIDSGSSFGSTLHPVSKVVNALQSVHDRIVEVIEEHSRRRSSASVHCSQFIEDIEELTMISHNVSYAEEIVRLSSEISSLEVENCNSDHIETLHEHRETLSNHINLHLGHISTFTSSTFSSKSTSKYILLYKDR